MYDLDIFCYISIYISGKNGYPPADLSQPSFEARTKPHRLLQTLRPGFKKTWVPENLRNKKHEKNNNRKTYKHRTEQHH